MAEHLTSKERVVNHEHFDADLHAADQAIASEFIAKLFPAAEVVNPATINYNCHGFALAPSHLGWYNFPDLFLSDDYDGVPMDSPQPGDVLIYSLEGVLTHSAIVIEVDGSDIVRVQSKWGGVAEVKHAPGVVPDVYGEPIVLLRPQDGVATHPAANGVVDASVNDASDTSVMAGAGDEAATANMAASMTQNAQVPERFRLLLASTPEVHRRIMQSGSVTQRSGGNVPFRARPRANNLTDSESEETTDDSSADSTQEEIKKALEELSSGETQFRLILASTPEVLRVAASRLPPVAKLIEIAETNPEANRAVLEFFEKPETQSDEQITCITLFLLSQLPSKEAVTAIARYLLTGNVSTVNGGLAVEALRAAVTLPSA